MNRLTQAWSNGSNWGETFTTDPWGSMWQRSPVTGKTNYEPLSAPANLQNQLIGFGYDVAGNMIQNGSATYTYDGDNRLTATAGWTYVYDGDDVRVEKRNGSTGTLYWTGTGSEAISESNLAGTDQEEYIFFGAERVARRDVATNAVHYYFSDHLGSASIVTNTSGAIEDESDYYPYGGEMVITNTVPQNYKFTGKERDAESGLDDFGARYHASALGRFMTPDWDAKPVAVPYAKFGDPQTLNLYSYVENDPVNRADADGHQNNQAIYPTAPTLCGQIECGGGPVAEAMTQYLSQVSAAQAQDKNETSDKRTDVMLTADSVPPKPSSNTGMQSEMDYAIVPQANTLGELQDKRNQLQDDHATQDKYSKMEVKLWESQRGEKWQWQGSLTGKGHDSLGIFT